MTWLFFSISPTFQKQPHIAWIDALCWGPSLPLSDGGGDGGGGSAGHRGRGGAGHRGRGVVVIRGHEVVAVAAASLQKKGSRPCQANHRKGSEELHGD